VGHKHPKGQFVVSFHELLPVTTHAKEPGTVDVLFGQDDLEITLKEDKHHAKVCDVKLGELMGVCVREAILSEDLDNHGPSPYDRLVCRSRSRSYTVLPPPFPESLADIIGQGCLGVGVDGGQRPNHPDPQALGVEPIHLARFLERKILERKVSVFGLAGKEILVVDQVLTT
jgi:hypothetical protein